MNSIKSVRKTTGKTYPFSSQRQALHHLRRAQGGPGITEGKDPQAKEVK